ncbi:hypothetical protein GCM10022236_32190 [Microlunatus ginsengisoli]|uniref:Uncharacterized protein n=1 Tax=Microlunatus ginsengisoli TaxID=363863 RepID=A0ABP7A992_9ACTN
MRRIWSVAIPRDGRDEDSWRRIGDVVRGWSRRATITPVGDVMWLADTESAEVADALSDELAALRVEPLRSARTVYDDEDYAEADLIGVFGVDLTLDPPFVLDADRALTPDPPCPRCGHHDAFDVRVSEPLRIDPTLLDGRAADGSRPGPRGWEVANLPTGGLLLSARLLDRFEAAGIRGLEREPVLHPDGRVSRRAAAIRAGTVVLTPCPRHTRIEGDPFCPVCGTAHGSLDGFFWMPRGAVGDADAVSRHPHGAAMLYLSRRAYDLLDGVPGVRRGDPVRICAD